MSAPPPPASPGGPPPNAPAPRAANAGAPAAGGDGGFRLLPLSCPGCGAPIAAEGEDVIYYCTACRSAYRLAPRQSPGSAVLEPVEVSFVAVAGKVAQRYLPFWLLPAKVEIFERKAAGGGLRSLLNFFTGDRGGGPGMGTFAIPAFDCPVDRATALAHRYTEAFPRLGERLGEKLTGGRLSVEDAQKLAHFTLIASEAEKPDTLEELRYAITFSPASLLGVPFVLKIDLYVDALFSLPA
jgi:hypothetical protein